MGSSKIACVHITRENIRLVEGRVQNGVMLLTRTAIIQKANRFLSAVNGKLWARTAQSIREAGMIAGRPH